MRKVLLEVRDLYAGYGGVDIVQGVSFNVDEGEKVTIIGPNGAGKTTLLKAIMGLIPCRGEIKFLNEKINGLSTHKIVERGIVLVPEGGKIFPKLTVLENLKVSAQTMEAKKHEEESLREIFKIFPILKERKDQIAGTLSGGERRMLSIAMGLMSLPKLMIIDELSLGLMPVLVPKLFDILKTLNEQGLTIILVEQYVRRALEFADRGYLMERGRIVLQGAADELLRNKYIKEAYL